MGRRVGVTALVGVAQAALVGVAEGAGASLRAAHEAAAAAAVKCADKRAAVAAASVTSDAVPKVSTTVPTVPTVQTACAAPSRLRATAAKTEMVMTLQADAPGMYMFRLDSIAPPQTSAKVVKAPAPTTQKAPCSVIAVDATVVTAVITKVLVKAVRVSDEMESASVLVVVLLLEQLLVLHGVALVMTTLQLHAMAPPPVSTKVATAATPTMTMALRGSIAVGVAVGTMFITMLVTRALTMSAEAESVSVHVVVLLLMMSLHLNVVAPVEAMLLSLAMGPPRTSAKVVTAAATPLTPAPGEVVLMSVAVAPAVVKTGMPAALKVGAKVEGASVPVAKTGVLAVLRVDTKVEGASVVVLVLVELLVELFVMVAMMTMSMIHPLVPPSIFAEVATAVATTMTTAPGDVVVMIVAVVPVVGKTGMPAALRVGANV